VSILVVDDDPKIRRLMRVELRANDYQVTEAANGEEALDLMAHDEPTLVLLDLMLPGIDGMEVLRRLRETSSVPVIIISAKHQDMDRIKGLQLGADDYITKPFNTEEVIERVRAVLRRARASSRWTEADSGGIDHLIIDFDRRQVTVDGKAVILSPKEWQLLDHFAANPGRTLLHEDLLENAWGREAREDVQSLRVWINRLRQKLERNPAQPRLIRTVQGVGYIFNARVLEPEGGARQQAPARRSRTSRARSSSAASQRR
jgi:two-component system, OmpR family, KDP operon response regulator KdpE